MISGHTVFTMRPLRTLKQARAYAAQVLEMTGKRHLVFRVPPCTAAAEAGFRYGTCEESERPEYEAAGAKFFAD